jgi:hypothetical protein
MSVLSVARHSSARFRWEVVNEKKKEERKKKRKKERKRIYRPVGQATLMD